MAEPISFGKPEFNLTAGMESVVGRPEPDTPFQILLMGDFSGRASRPQSADAAQLAGRRPVFIDRDNFDEVMARLKVSLRLSLQDGSGPELNLRFSELDDFHPDRIYEQVEIFQSLRQTRKKLGDPAKFDDAAAEVQNWLSTGQPAEPAPESPPIAESSGEKISADFLLEKVIGESENLPQPVRSEREWDSFLEGIVRPHAVARENPQKEQLISCVDLAISGLMREILHHPDFQALEAAWRALYFLTSRCETGTDLKIFLLDITKAELKDDLQTPDDLRATGTYKLLAEQTVETPGADPWAVVAGNYTFTDGRSDLDVLGRMAVICRRADAPFIAAASSVAVGCVSLAATPDPDEWETGTERTGAADWNALRQIPSATYLGLLLPRFLLRLPYGADTDPIERFEFEEMDQPPEHEHYLWGNPAFVGSCLLAQTFSRSGWDFSSGLVHELENLPLHLYRQNGEAMTRPCAETVLTQRAFEILMEKGLMPLISFKGRDVIRLGRLQSLASPAQTLAGRWET